MLVLWVAMGRVPGARAEDGAPGEYEIKAAFLYNFARYVEWPDDAVKEPRDAFVVSILGEDPFGGVLDRIAERKTVQDKRIVVRRLKSMADYTPCHLLFIASSEEARLAEVADRLKAAPVLTVGDGAGWARRGTVMSFTMEERKVRFEANLEAAKRTGLKISSQLLRLARIVKDD